MPAATVAPAPEHVIVDVPAFNVKLPVELLVNAADAERATAEALRLRTLVFVLALIVSVPERVSE